MKEFFDQLTRPEIMAEVVAVIMAGLLATGNGDALPHLLEPGEVKEEK